METRGRSFSKSRILILGFFLFFLVFTSLQFLGPIMIPKGTVLDLTGLVGVKNNEAIINELSEPWSSVYNCGDSLCHQITTRSFFINENQMPFCARCTAIWLGITIGLGLTLFYRIKLDDRFIFVIIFGIVPIGIDGLGQLFGFWESNNIIRVLTGLPIGIICGIAIGIIIDELGEIIISRKTKSN